MNNKLYHGEERKTWIAFDTQILPFHALLILLLFLVRLGVGTFVSNPGGRAFLFTKDHTIEAIEKSGRVVAVTK